MEDETYASALLDILTNPDPTGVKPGDPYGQADDGIDRYDGFGRDVWVESIKVGPGEYGAELVVEFAMNLPPDQDQGASPPDALRLPFDAEWRQLSGYEDPAAYAPVVAREVEIAAGKHVERHRRETKSPAGHDGNRPGLPGRDEQWRMLVDALAGEGTVREVAPGRLELHGSDRGVVTVVVSRDQWEQVLLDHAGGDIDMYFADLLGPRYEDELFVVHYNGDLRRSTREKLPPVRSRALERRFQELRASHPGAQFAWRARRPSKGQGPTI